MKIRTNTKSSYMAPLTESEHLALRRELERINEELGRLF